MEIYHSFDFGLLGRGCGRDAIALQDRFQGTRSVQSIGLASEERKLEALPIGERTAAVGQALVGTRYKHFTLEIDNRIESPSVNFQGMDCWTFFEISLAFARMLDEAEENWTPDRLLHYIEVDRYRGGECTGEYLSRLHYLEDWLFDNDRRGLIVDLTRELGGASVPHSAREMTVGWRHYRYLAAQPIAARVRWHKWKREFRRAPFIKFQNAAWPQWNRKLRNGDIIGIISRDRSGLYSTAHVGLALRTSDGVLHFMHASSPGNSGRVVVVDSRLSSYLARYRSDSAEFWLRARCGNSIAVITPALHPYAQSLRGAEKKIDVKRIRIMKTLLSILLAIAAAVPVWAETKIRVGHFPNVTHVQGLVGHALSRQGKGWFEERLGRGKNRLVCLQRRPERDGSDLCQLHRSHLCRPESRD